MQIVKNLSSPTVIKIPGKEDVTEDLVDKVMIPEGFSPNDDGQNDVLEAAVPEGIEVEMFELYNRWGHLVWKYKGATTTNGQKLVWDATSNTGLRFGPEGVPDGTYFYSIKVKGQSKVRTNFITIVR